MSVFQQILASLGSTLLGTPTQNARLLRLHTPLGEEVLLAERAEVLEAIGPAAVGAGLRIELHALAEDTHLELKSLIGQPVLLELLLADGSLRAWHAHVSEAALLGSDGGLARYRLVLEPWLAFLAHGQDSWVFQDMTVMQIVDEVLGDYAGQGKLAPAWRWDLADASVYPQRSLCIQYQESDLAFVQRLLREEGLFCWFEHVGDTESDSLGSHTLVIADHNDAFAPNPQDQVRFTQSGAALAEDSLMRWSEGASLRTARLAQASADYRSLSLRPLEQTGSADGIGEIEDVPGAYAYEDSAQGERLVLRQMQALDAWRSQLQAAGSYRQAAPGTSFTLTDHAQHDGLDAERDAFVILSASHTMRNNLSADHKATVLSLLGAIRSTGKPDLANAGDEPIYACALTVQPLALPVRMAMLDEHGQPDVRLSPRPTIHGVQTAIVVGSGPVHTDRDHRVKIQFHWQRGGYASHRLDHPAGDNAPASDASGTWVRVAEGVAGANWGANFTPRVGQEVLVGFSAGDIDRPLVLGAVYNGRGAVNAQGNEVAGGAAGASGNAPAWFPGSEAGHNHDAVLSGHKSQELGASAAGSGGYNQIVFDDTPGQGRIEWSTTSAQTRLQMGHLLQQGDNQRLAARGHGIDLATSAWGAVRAGSGLLVSAHPRGAQPQQMDAREAQTMLQQSKELIHTLADSAVKQNAALAGETELAVEKALKASDDSLAGTQTLGDSTADIGGGFGSVNAWTRPDLILAAPAGIGSYTPAAFIASAGNSASLSAGQDLQHLAQANHALAAKDGLVLYTYGKATNTDKPNQETGIKLHAATGGVNTQSQSGATRLTADKAVDVASTQGMVRITAPTHVLLSAAGAAIDINGQNITLKGPGAVEFRASMKELAGGASAPPGSLNLTHSDLEMPSPLPQSRSLQWQAHGADGAPITDLPFELVHDNSQIASGATAGGGQSLRHQREQDYSEYSIWLGKSGWAIGVEEADGDHPVPMDEQIYETDADNEEEQA